MNNKTTLMGRIKRFQRRKPRLAQLIRFSLVLCIFGFFTLAIIPGSSIPLQEKAKIWIFHKKSAFNYYFNYQIGKQKQKYLYLLLQDLLSQMNNHQIHNLEQIKRVFGQVERIFKEQQRQIWEWMGQQMSRIERQKQTKAESYVQMNQLKDTDKTKNPTNSVISKLSTKDQSEFKIKNNQQSKSNYEEKNIMLQNNKNQPSNSNFSSSPKNKRQLLKQQMRQQIQSKSQKSQSKSPIMVQQNQQKAIKISQQGKHFKENSKKQNFSLQNTKNFVNSNLLQTKKETQKSTLSELSSKTQNPSTLSKSSSIKQLFSSKLIYSPAFLNNLLMYYVLVLQNVLRYDVKIIKQPKLYQIYQKGINYILFINQIKESKNEIHNFNDQDLQNIQKNNLQIDSKVQNFFLNNQLFMDQLKDQYTRQINFVLMLRNSMYTNNKNQKVISDKTKLRNKIDPHKILAYLINYRHLTEENDIKKEDKNIRQLKKNERIKQLLKNYVVLINKFQDKKASIKKLDRRNENTKQFLKFYQQLKQKEVDINVEYAKGITYRQNNKEFANYLIEQGMSNKNFVASLKSMYVEEKIKQEQKKIGEQQRGQRKEVIRKVEDEKKDSKQSWVSKMFGVNKDNLESENKGNKQKQLQKTGQEKQKQKLSNQPAHVLIERIFNIYDDWYRQNEATKENI